MNFINHKEVSIYIVLSVLLAALFLTFFSPSTSWLYTNHPYSCDSSIFQIIGKYWANGECLPYKDLWDLKGPIIFALNALGYLLTGSKVGVSLVQTFFLSISILSLFLIFHRDIKRGFIVVLLTLAAMAPTMNNDGNIVSEYALPLLIWSYWLLSLSFSKSYKPVYALVFGLCIGWCLMSRLTDCVGILGCLLGLLILLVTDNKLKDILISFAWLMVGLGIPVLPFAIYFGIKGLEYELWYGTILYNIGYADNSLSGFGSLFDLIYTLKNYLPLVLMLLVSISLVCKSTSRRRGIVWTLSTSLSLVWFLISRMAPPYAAITLPYIMILFIEFRNIREEQILSTHTIKKLEIITIVLFVITFLKQFYNVPRNMSAVNNDWLRDKELVSLVPKNDRDAFIAYDWQPETYLFADIKPCYPYFTLQDFECGMSKTLRPRLIKTFSTCRAKWILISGYDRAIIKSIIDNNYSLVAEKGGKKLFKKQ